MMSLSKENKRKERGIYAVTPKSTYWVPQSLNTQAHDGLAAGVTASHDVMRHDSSLDPIKLRRLGRWCWK